MARQILEGSRDEGRAAYQVAMSVCPECARGAIESRGKPVPVGPEIVEMACCDAQQIGDVNRAAGAHTGRATDTHVGHAGRATQEIPPSIRRQVMRRDRGRCQVPGCRCSLWVDIHPIRLRSEGGIHDPDLTVVLCSAHHRALHRGALVLEGTVSSGLEFRHADGTRYGGPVRAETAAACLDAQAALRSLGFGESESRRAVGQAREDGQSSEVPGDLVGAALRLLRPRPVHEARAEYRVTPRGIGERCVGSMGFHCTLVRSIPRVVHSKLSPSDSALARNGFSARSGLPTPIVSTLWLMLQSCHPEDTEGGICDEDGNTRTRGSVRRDGKPGPR